MERIHVAQFLASLTSFRETMVSKNICVEDCFQSVPARLKSQNDSRIIAWFWSTIECIIVFTIHSSFLPMYAHVISACFIYVIQLLTCFWFCVCVNASRPFVRQHFLILRSDRNTSNQHTSITYDQTASSLCLLEKIH